MNREKYKKLLLSLLCVIIIVASVGFIDANSKNAPLEETDARSLQAAEQAELKPGDLTAQQLETATLAEADRHELTKQYDANRNGHEMCIRDRFQVSITAYVERSIAALRQKHDQKKQGRSIPQENVEIEAKIIKMPTSQQRVSARPQYSKAPEVDVYKRQPFVLVS